MCMIMVDQLLIIPRSKTLLPLVGSRRCWFKRIAPMSWRSDITCSFSIFVPPDIRLQGHCSLGKLKSPMIFKCLMSFVVFFLQHLVFLWMLVLCKIVGYYVHSYSTAIFVWDIHDFWCRLTITYMNLWPTTVSLYAVWSVWGDSF